MDTPTTQTNGHKTEVISIEGSEDFYAECLSCDWTGEIHRGDAGEGAEAEATNEAEGHETDLAYPQAAVTTLYDRLQALASQVGAQIAVSNESEEQLNPARRMKADLEEAAGVIAMTDGLIHVIAGDGATDVGGLRILAEEIRRRIEFANPEP